MPPFLGASVRELDQQHGKSSLKTDFAGQTPASRC
jgi:hypothetical protein